MITHINTGRVLIFTNYVSDRKLFYLLFSRVTRPKQDVLFHCLSGKLELCPQKMWCCVVDKDVCVFKIQYLLHTMTLCWYGCPEATLSDSSLYEKLSAWLEISAQQSESWEINKSCEL